MVIGTAILSIFLFLFSLHWYSVLRVAKKTISTALGSIDILRDQSLSDKDREKKLQKASLTLLGAFISILIRSILAIITSILPILIADYTHFVSAKDVYLFLSRWDVIVVTTISISALAIVWIRQRQPSETDYKTNYSILDKLLHQLAFSSTKIQLTAADIEKCLFKKKYDVFEANNPIFITSLPRAGTTILLEVLWHFPSLASHTYRDMPFMMAPVLWSRLSNSFWKHTEKRERAHGDGMKYNYDSPEAFEEILWKTFWPEKYTENCIRLWDENDAKIDAFYFIVEHMKKILMLRRPDRKMDGRYISKNNSNIARLDLIADAFPGSKVLMPIRHPLEHAASLHKQHLNFLKMHNNEAFIRTYMSDLGHYEFGELHRPIAFPRTHEYTDKLNPLHIDYWLAYWISAYEYVLSRRDKVIFISYEGLCRNPKIGLGLICKNLDIQEEAGLDNAASLFREPSKPRRMKNDYDQELEKLSEELYHRLISYALI